MTMSCDKKKRNGKLVYGNNITIFFYHYYLYTDQKMEANTLRGRVCMYVENRYENSCSSRSLNGVICDSLDDLRKLKIEKFLVHHLFKLIEFDRGM